MARPSTIVLAGVLALGLAATRFAAGQEPARPAEPAKAEGSSSEPAKAQPKPERANAAADRPTATLRVQVVVSQLRNDKKLASIPYSFVVAARPAGVNRSDVRMRMGVDTPLPVIGTGEGGSPKVGGYQYKKIGTDIDCRGHDLGDGRYQLFLSVDISSALPGSQNPDATGALAAVPLFRHFEGSINPILRDGQTIQTVAATDPVTGEVVKIDVTMNVVR